MVMVLAPLRGKAEVRRGQGGGGRKGRERIDTTKAEPVTKLAGGRNRPPS